MTVEERLQPASVYKPELASLNMGSMNFGLFPLIAKYEGKWIHEWEPAMLERSRDESVISRLDQLGPISAAS